MKGLLYRLRMARADRIWEAARRAERRVHVETGSYAEANRELSIQLMGKAKRIEERARRRKV